MYASPVVRPARPRAASGEYGVLIGRESAPIANRRKMRSAERAPNKAVRANQKFRGLSMCQLRSTKGRYSYYIFSLYLNFDKTRKLIDSLLNK